MSNAQAFTLQTSRFQRHVLEHRRRHRWRGFDDFRMNGQISHVNSMWSQFLRDMSDMATVPRQARGDRALENMEIITDDTRNCWGNAIFLFQWVQWTKDSQTEAIPLGALHGFPVSKFEFRPKDQAASTLESTFLFWRRFMTLLEIHLLQMCKCCEAALDVEIWARIGPLAIWTLNSGTSAICKS